MSKPLREKAVSGVFWSAVERIGQQGCGFIVQLFLARLLAPEEFGLIAMVSVFIAISMALVDAGFGAAIIQKKKLTERDLSTVFYYNIVASIVLMAVMYVTAPYVSNFYSEEQLTTVLRWLSISLVLGSIGGVHTAILTRYLQFKKLFWVSVPSVVVGGAIGVTMACMGYGVWSLVGQSLGMQVVRSGALWFQARWKPQFIFDWESLRSMLPFGARAAVSSVLDRFFQNIYVLVIGKVFSPVSVGYFQRAKSFQQMPVLSIQSILGRVAFPLFASIQDEPERMKRGMRKALQLGALCSFTAMAGMAAVAEPMVVTLIGEKWLPAVPYLKWLCIVGALFPIHAMNLNLLMALGKSKLFLRLEILKKILIVTNIFVTYRFGIQVMIYGMLVTSMISLFINAYFTKKFIAYSISEQFKDVLPIFAISIVMFCGVMAGCFWVEWNQLLKLGIGIVIGVGIAALGLRFLSETLKDELSPLFQKMPRGASASRALLYWKL